MVETVAGRLKGPDCLERFGWIGKPSSVIEREASAASHNEAK